MSSEAESVPIAVEYRNAPLEPADTHRRGWALALAVLAASAALAVSACSSKNQDALPGMNVDENLAMMNANESVESNFATRNGSDTNAGSENYSRPTGGSSTEPTSALGSLNHREPSAEANAIGRDANDSPQENETAPNQIEGDEDQPPNAR